MDEDEGRSKERQNKLRFLGLKKNHWIAIGITFSIILGLYFGLKKNEDKEGDDHYERNIFELLFLF